LTGRAVMRWAWVAAALAALVWWALHVPLRPGRILEAIPDRAEILWVADAPGPRIGRIAANPLLQAALAAAGMEMPSEEDLAAFSDPDHWLAPFLDDEAAVAVLPAGLVSVRPTVVVSAWAGFDARRLRWVLPFFPEETFRRRGSYEGVRLTEIDLGLEPPLAATLALDGGVAVLCLSDNPRAVLAVLDTLFGRSPSITDRVEGLAERAADLRPSAPDRFWWFPAGGSSLGLYVSEWSRDALRGRVLFGEPGEILAVAPPGARRGDDGGGAAPLPLAAAGMEADRLAGALQRAGWERVAAAWERLAQRAGAGRLTAALYDGALAGRIKGFRIPSLVLGADVADERAAQAALLEFIDGLNASHRLGLIPHGRQVADAEIVSVTGAAGLYGSLPESECIATMVYGGRLYVASNPLVLEQLLEGGGRFPGAAEWGDGPGDWLTIHPDRAVEAARLGLSVYALKLWADNSAESDRTRALVQRIRQGIEPLGRFGEASFRAVQWADPVVIDLDLLAGEHGEDVR
jgi:hypothetical protein